MFIKKRMYNANAFLLSQYARETHIFHSEYPKTFNTEYVWIMWHHRLSLMLRCICTIIYMKITFNLQQFNCLRLTQSNHAILVFIYWFDINSNTRLHFFTVSHWWLSCDSSKYWFKFWAPIEFIHRPNAEPCINDKHMRIEYMAILLPMEYGCCPSCFPVRAWYSHFFWCWPNRSIDTVQLIASKAAALEPQNWMMNADVW